MNAKWSIDLVDMIDYKKSNNKGYWCNLVVFDKFSKYTWCISLFNKNAETLRNDFSKTLATHRRPKIESDGGAEFYNSFLDTFY